MRKDTKGFTPVELSIVLVLIGLLIGGILAAQSMIRTAKIQSFVREINQFDVAVSNFQTKYGGLPGDTTSMGCGNPPAFACGDGLISCSPSYPNPNTFDGETANFWVHLQRGVGFNPVPGATFSNDVSGNVFKIKGTTINAPPLPVGNNSAPWVTTFDPGGGLVTNYYIIADWPDAFAAGHTAFNVGTATIPAADALAIDAKIDDGKATTSPNVTMIDLWNNGGRCSDGSGNYLSGDPTAVCILGIKMFGSIGEQN